MEELEIVASQAGGLIQVSLTKSGPATAFPFARENDFESECFQDGDSRDPNLRLVITHKSVVPKNDSPTRLGAILRISPHEPVIESLLRIMGQRTTRRNPQRFFHERAQRRKVEGSIRD